jgi:hypothetical protein
MRREILTPTRIPAALLKARTGCTGSTIPRPPRAGSTIPRPPRAFLLLALVSLAACKTPTQQELIERQSGVYTLISAGGVAPPFVEMSGGTRLEILSGNITLHSNFVAQGWRACSFTVAFRETGDGEAARDGTETVPCRFGSIIGHTLHFQLQEGAGVTRRFENVTHDAAQCSVACIEGQFGGDYSIRITDRMGIPFVFRK